MLNCNVDQNMLCMHAKNWKNIRNMTKLKSKNYILICVQNYCLYKAAWVNVLICVTYWVLFLFFSCCSWLTTLGGGIPHGVFLESGGSTVGLTQHRPGKEGRHVSPCSPATTPLTTLASVSKTANRAGPQSPPSALSKGKGGKRGSVTWAPKPSCEFEPQSDTSSDCKMASDPGTNSNIKMANDSCSNLNSKIGSKPDTNSITKLGPESGTNLDTTMNTALGTNSGKSNAEPGINSNANKNISRPMAEQVPHTYTDRVMDDILNPAVEVLENRKSSIDSSSEQERKRENGNGHRGSGEEIQWESASSIQSWVYGWPHVFRFSQSWNVIFLCSACLRP